MQANPKCKIYVLSIPLVLGDMSLYFRGKCNKWSVFTIVWEQYYKPCETGSLLITSLQHHLHESSVYGV